jgi:hypothetical protein
MAGPKKISELTSADPIDGANDLLPISQSGVTNKVTPDELNKIKTGFVKIATSDVLTSNGTPIKIIDAPGAGYAIQLVQSAGLLDYNATPYATHTSVELYTDTATKAQAVLTGFLEGTVQQLLTFQDNAISFPPGPTDTVLINNKAVYFRTKTGNPTGGDSDITIHYAYRIIKL